MSAAIPTAAQYLSADAANPGVSIRFNQSTSGTNIYDLYRSTSSGNETASVPVVNLSNTGGGPNRGSISDTTPITGTKYYYEVISVATPASLPPNAPSGITYYAEGPGSAEVSFKPGGSPPSSAPASLTATSKNFASAVFWGTVTGAVSYNLYYYVNAPTFTPSQNVILATNSSSTTISNIPYIGSSNSLQVAVSAVNGDGEGPLSSQVSATLLGYGLQSSPASTTIARGQHGSVTITMPAANGFTGPVPLSVSGAPTGVTAWLDTSLPTVVLSDALGNGTGNGIFPTNDSEGSTLFLSVGSNATPGAYTLTITGNATAAAGASYNFTQAITVTLNIT